MVRNQEVACRIAFNYPYFKCNESKLMNISLRVDDDTRARLDKIAERMDRPRAWVALEGIKQFLDYQEWFVRSVEKAISEADAGGPFVSHDEVVADAAQRRRERQK